MQNPKISNHQPSSLLLGLDSLYKIKNDALNYYESLHTNYGDAVKVRLGPYRCWFLFHPTHIEQVLAKQADKFIRFERIMNVLRQWNGESLLIAEGNSWKSRRRKVLPAFTQQRIPKYAELVCTYAKDYTSLIKHKIQEQGEFHCDIDHVMAQYSLDIAGITLFGEKLGTNSKEISESVHELSRIAYTETTSLFTIPDVIPTPSNLHKKQVIKTMKANIKSIIDKRITKQTPDQGDLLSILMTFHQNDITSIEEDVMSLLIAGHETSGATLTWIFLLLSKNQKTLNQLHEELDRVIPNGNITYQTLKHLPYLTAIAHEALRLYPAAYALFCRRATQEVELGNILLRKGDLVQILPYSTHRDERWFKQANKFIPERFLSETHLPKYAYFPFGAGPRVCIGQSFGMMKIILTTATILKDLSIKPNHRIPKASPRFSLRPEKNSNLSFVRRNNSTIVD